MAYRLLNLLVTIIWLLIFQAFGWISFSSHDTILGFIVAALIIWLVSSILDIILALTILATLCADLYLGCAVAFGLIFAENYIALYLVAAITKLYSINVDFFFLGLLMSILFALFRPNKKRHSKSYNYSNFYSGY